MITKFSNHMRRMVASAAICCFERSHYRSNVLGNIFMKLGSSVDAKHAHIFGLFGWQTLLGIGFFASGVIFMDLTQVLPLYLAQAVVILQFVGVILAAAILFREAIEVQHGSVLYSLSSALPSSHVERARRKYQRHDETPFTANRYVPTLEMETNKMPPSRFTAAICRPKAWQRAALFGMLGASILLFFLFSIATLNYNDFMYSVAPTIWAQHGSLYTDVPFVQAPLSILLSWHS